MHIYSMLPHSHLGFNEPVLGTCKSHLVLHYYLSLLNQG